MIYLLNKELNKNNTILMELKKIYGIGSSTSKTICKKLGFSSSYKVVDLSNENVNNIIREINSLNLSISNDLKQRKNLQILKLINIKCCRGLRRLRGLPVRGQRTHTNYRTSRKLNKKY